MDLKKFIRTFPDFPEPGIDFRDISPLLANGPALHYTVHKLADFAREADVIVGPDARGFIFATPVSAILKKPFVMVRKAGKLPGPVFRKTYQLEYNKTTLEIQRDAIRPGQKVVIIDDLLATGGTTRAIVDLIEKHGAKVIGVLFVVELVHLKGRQKYHGISTHSLIQY
ncbi:adenine phosphoribosyltransferase [Mycoplasma sp. ATU-Cv-703]|uniref:adenine phosphoribosyltransferase n=1 Tax=Mycoplasma sp. ATU-Cv-703 TaxID=2498595 RepID=UPI000FDD8701